MAGGDAPAPGERSVSRPPLRLFAATLADLLRRYRLAAELTQEELAERAGLSARTLRYLEGGGGRQPYRETVRRLADALQLAPPDRHALEQAARAAVPKPPPTLAPVPPAIASPSVSQTAAPPTAWAPASPRRPNLPRPLTRLLGRTWELVEVTRRLRGERLVTLVGAGGAGKTRLALEVAAGLADYFPAGVWFVNLAPVRAPELVLPAVARAMGLPERAGQAVAEALADHLAERDVLLLLDNFEAVVAAAPAMVALLEAAPRLRVLATSREPLRVRGEHVLPVPPLDFPEVARFGWAGPPPLNTLLGFPAVALFVERVQAADPGFALTPEASATVARIVARLDGLPLAIELAASRVPPLTLAELAGQLDTRLDLLTDGPRDLPARQRTLRDTMAWSYDLLSEPERRLFRRCGVFTGGATLATLAALDEPASAPAGPTPSPPPAATTAPVGAALPGQPDVATTVAALVSRSLLQLDAAADAEPRYRLLETVAEYAVAALVAQGEQVAVRQRHAEVMLALATQAAPHLTGPSQNAWLDRLEQEHDNFRAALDWALGHGEADLALRLAAALGPFWDVRGHWREGRRWLERSTALAPADAALAAARVAAVRAAGTLATNLGEPAQAGQLLSRAADLARGAGDDAGLTAALNGLARVALETGDYAAARRSLDTALPLVRRGGDVEPLADTLHQLARLAYEQTDYARAQAYFEECLPLFRRQGHTRGIASAVNSLGMLADMRGDWPAARPLYAEALRLRREAGNLQGVGASLNNLACVTLAEGDFATARDLFEQNLALRRELGDSVGIATALHNLGWVARLRGEHATAEARLDAALALRRAASHQRGVASTLNQLGHLARAQGRPALAAARLAESLALARQLGDQARIADLLCAAAVTAAASGRRALAADAVALYAAADPIRLARGAAPYPPERADEARCLASVRLTAAETAPAREAGAIMSAEQAMEEASRLLRQLGDRSPIDVTGH